MHRDNYSKPFDHVDWANHAYIINAQDIHDK